MRGWACYGDFLQTLGRWLLGDELPPGLALRPQMDGTDLRLDLFYDQTWEERLAASAPQITLADGPTGKTRPLVWEHLEPGHFRAVTTLPSGLRVVTDRMAHLETVSLGVWVGAGSRHEHDDE